jgi:hypothetical protein
MLTRLRERLAGGNGMQASPDLSAPGDPHWDSEG